LNVSKNFQNIDKQQNPYKRGLTMAPRNQTDFAVAIELPSVTDTAYRAMYEGKDNAVAALTRVMERQKLAQQIGPFIKYVR
jgi:hypothetical protein